MRLWMIFFCSGIVSTAWFPILPGLAVCLLLMVIPLIVITFIALIKAVLIKRSGGLFYKFLTIVLWTLLAFTLLLAGVGYSGWVGQKHIQESIPGKWKGKTIVVTGRIAGIPQHKNNLWQFMLEDVSAESVKLKGRLRLSWYSYRNLQPGESWRLSVKLKPAHGVVSPGAFDAESWLRREHVAGTGYVIRNKQNKCLHTDIWRIDVWRYRLMKYIESTLPLQCTGLAQALLLGNKKAIPADDWALFNKTGTTHLLVISGLHIGLMFTVGYMLTSWLRYLGIFPLALIALPRIAVMLGLVMSMFYALLAGFSVPVQRSLIMLLCGCAGRLLDFVPKPSTVWLVAMTGVLLLEPMAVTSAGFWYSFTAVAALLLVFSNRTGTLPWWKRWWLPQWCVFVALLPLLFFYGQPSCWWSPLVNMVSIPLIGIMIVPLLMLGVVVSLMPGHFSWILYCAVFLLNGWRDVLQWMSAGSEVPAGYGIDSWFVLLICIAGGIYLLLPRGMKWYWLAFPCLLLIWLPTGRKVPYGKAEIALLDDRRTGLVVIQTRKHVLVYDLGDKSLQARFTSTQSTLLPFLRQRHIASVDTWILPRYNSNTLSGQQFLQTFQVNAVYAARPQLTESGCNQPKQWRWDGVEFTLLPEKNTCVLRIQAGEHRALLSGVLSSVRVKERIKKAPETMKGDLWIVTSPIHDASVIRAVSARYIALPQHDPYRASRQIEVFRNAIADSCYYHVDATAYTGTQYYRLGYSSGIQASFARSMHHRWWFYRQTEDVNNY